MASYQGHLAFSSLLGVAYGGVAAIVRGSLKPFTAELRLLRGKKVWEILPRELEGKGAAVRATLAQFPDSVLPVYVGDDTADESAFAVLRHGLTVRVGTNQTTRARFRLRNPKEVVGFLRQLEATVD